MFIKLLLLFTIFPFIEIYLLMKLGAHFGFLTTLFVVIGTGALGAYLAKMEGIRVLARISNEYRSGRYPTDDLIDAGLLCVAGLVLITPGLITDILGLCLLFPITRTQLREAIKKKIQEYLERNRPGGQSNSGPVIVIED